MQGLPGPGAMEATWGFRSLLGPRGVSNALVGWGLVFMGALWEPEAEEMTRAVRVSWGH